ncbi:hypothetical protein COOONC_06944 [Cooperia oncophora]
MITELQALLASEGLEELNVDGDLLRRIVHLLVKIAVNMSAPDLKIENIIDNHPVGSLLKDDERTFICKSVDILREHPENISGLTRHQVQSHTCGDYLDSSIRFDRNVGSTQFLI